MTDQELTDIADLEQAIAPIVRDNDAVIAEALAVIDAALGRVMQRELVSSGEVGDVLLDLRSLLVSTTSAV